MTLPKLTDFEYEEMTEELTETYYDFLWFIEISADFFNSMYGNIYQEYIEYNKYDEVEEEEKEEKEE